MSDVICPYCNHSFDHDCDDAPDQDEMLEIECQNPECAKIFTAIASYSLDYVNITKSPCLNGEQHELEQVFHAPRHYPDWVRCKNCTYETRGKFVDC